MDESRDARLDEADQLEERAKALRAEAHTDRLARLAALPLAERLVYAATTRCEGCGAGMAYDPATSTPFGQWECSATLTGAAKRAGEEGAVAHTPPMPFTFWSVLSEDQISRTGGATTRPPDTPKAR